MTDTFTISRDVEASPTMSWFGLLISVDFGRYVVYGVRHPPMRKLYKADKTLCGSRSPDAQGVPDFQPGNAKGYRQSNMPYRDGVLS